MKYRLKRIGSLPGRLLLILVTILAISLPLTESFGQLRSEIIAKQQENRLRNAATEVWEKNFATSADGQARSYINQLSFQDRGSKLGVQLRVFTNKSYASAERSQYQQLLALKLARPLESIAFNLVESRQQRTICCGRCQKYRFPHRQRLPNFRLI
ncbi:MAG: hypothetical protein HC778_07155 [Chamaesiphon sp. CSU_1_12]|nr:hypothetical protein [Chamaesiphon sp. CSU_1_12]